ETIAVTIPRAASSSRIIVTRGQCPCRRETSQAQWRSGHFCTTTDHHIGIAVGNGTGTVANVMSTSGTRGGDGNVGATETMLDRQVPRDHVDDGAWHEEWRDTTSSALEQRIVVLLNHR